MGRISDVESAEDLINTLDSLRMAAVYDLFAQTLLHQFFKEIACGQADATDLVVRLPEGETSLNQFIDRLEEIEPYALRETKRNANRALTRNLFRESFRITQSYCKRTNQIEVLKEAGWYHFARVVANSLSHDFRLRFGESEGALLPVSYCGVEITASMGGEPLSMNLELLIRLVDDLIVFCRTIR